MKTLTDILSALAESMRLRVLALMAAEREACVCELVAALDEPQPKVSRHLAVLRAAGLVVDRRQAQWVFYSIATDLPPSEADVVASAVAAARETPQHATDRERLAAFPDRPVRCCVE